MIRKNYVIQFVACVVVLTAGAAAQETASASKPIPAVRTSTLVTPAVAPELITAPSKLSLEQVTRMQKKLRDWPQLKRYREENSRLGPPATGEKRVVFYGDSITDGWGRVRGKFFPGKPFVNRGISGQTTEQMVARFEQDVVGLRPDVVVILAGINDIAGNTGLERLSTIEDNFRAMVLMAKAAHIRVVVSSLLPSSRIKPRPLADPTQEVIELNQWLESFARQEHLIFLNYYPAMVDSSGGLKPELSFDKAVHPNDAGYAVMEPLAEAAVSEALKMPRP